MLSIRRLLAIIFIALGICLVFLVVDGWQVRDRALETVNDKFDITPLEIIGEAVPEKQTKFILVSGEESAPVLRNIRDLLERWGVGFSCTNYVSSFDEAGKPVYVFCQDSISSVTDLISLTEFVENGGRIVLAGGIAEGNADSYLDVLLGINWKADRVETGSFSFAEGFLPFQEETMAYDSFNASTSLRVRQDASVYVTDSSSGIPVVYSYPYGAGKAMVINGTLMEDSRCMGLLSGLLANELEGFAYPIVDVRAVFLDNFPVVAYVSDEDCMRVYGRRSNDFAQNVVWPVFQGYALRNQLKYTSSVLTVGTEASFFPEQSDQTFYAMGKSALSYGGEFVDGGDFSGEGALVENSSFYRKFQRFFPRYEITGLTVFAGKADTEQLAKQPNVIRSRVRGDGENATVSDVDIRDGIYYFPLITDSLSPDDGGLFDTAMYIASEGILSHRINMNELILNEAGEGAWDDNRKLIEDYWERIIGETDWMESLTLSEAADNIHGYRNLEYELTGEPDGIRIQCTAFRPGQAFLLHDNRKPGAVTGGEITPLNGDYYLVKVLTGDVRIDFE